MPVYNAANYLNESITSILGQTFADFEFLIFDDASTDNSKEIIQSFKDERIIFYESNINTGHLTHLNRGIEIARGAYIARMDADDISHPERFQMQIDAFLENEELGVCGTNYETFGEWEKEIVHPGEHREIFSSLLVGSSIAHPSVMLRKSLIQRHKIHYDPAYYTAEDYELWTRLAFLTQFKNIQRPLLKYRIQPNQISQSKSSLQKELSNMISLNFFHQLCLILIGSKATGMKFGHLFFKFLIKYERSIRKANEKQKLVNADHLDEAISRYYKLNIISQLEYNPFTLFKSIKSSFFYRLSNRERTKFIIKNLIFYRRERFIRIKTFITESYIQILVKLFRLKILDYYRIPIIINNFNRLAYLKILLDGLKSRGYHNIIILDNQSTYQPLLEFYSNNKQIKVIRLSKNLGHLALNQLPSVYNKIKYNFFVYTDPDLEVIDSCPKNFMEHFFKILNKDPERNKVGFGLKIDDLPEVYQFKRHVIEWEKQYHEKRLDGGFIANIDTTFCLHKPFTAVGEQYSVNAVRTDYPYLMRHLPWYEDSKHIPDESLFYNSKANASSSWLWGDDGVYKLDK